MSADNWAVCPNCVAKARKAAEEQRAAAMENYGKIPAAEFQTALATVKDVNPQDFCTFREDYEIYGAEDGEVTVNYGGSCETCGTHLEFTDRHAIPGAIS